MKAAKKKEREEMKEIGGEEKCPKKRVRDKKREGTCIRYRTSTIKASTELLLANT